MFFTCAESCTDGHTRSYGTPADGKWIIPENLRNSTGIPVHPGDDEEARVLKIPHERIPVQDAEERADQCALGVPGRQRLQRTPGQ